jgi:hypothetical protein
VNRTRCFVLLLLLVFQAACATVSGTPATAPDSSTQLALSLANANPGILTTKGIGHLNFTYSGGRQRLRIAWISEIPDKIRIAVLGTDGRPLMTAAVNPAGFAFLDHTTGDYRRGALEDFRVQAALPLPLDVHSLCLLLAGRLPQLDYDRALLVPGRTAGQQVLVLKKWWNRVARVTLQGHPAAGVPAIAHLETYRQTGERRYRVEIRATRMVAGYRVPAALAISTGDNAHFVLDIDRTWINAPVGPETFNLQPPD